MPEQPNESAPEGRAAFRGLSPLGPAVRRVSGAVVHAALLLLVSGVGAFVISPALYTQQIPEFSRDDIGKPFHSTSPTGFKAGRDYQLVNQTLTEQRRQEARSAVRPVYDYNPAVVGDLRASLHEGFAAMRDFLAQLDKESAHGAQGSSPADQESTAGKKKRRPEAAPAVDDELLASRLWAERRSFEHKLFPMEDEDFQALVAARFPLKAELAAISLIERAYHAPVATLRDELSQWGGQGITVRSLGSGGEQASSVAPPIVNDVQETKAELDRFASIPGYFLSDSPSPLRRAVLRLVKRQIRPNLTVNIAETEARRSQAAAAVKDVLIQVKKGQKVISEGELIDESHLAIFGAMRAHSDRRGFFEIQFGGAGLIALLVASAYAFHRAAFRHFRPSRKDALLLACLLIATLWLIRLAVTGADALHDKFARIPAEALYYAIPVAAGAMLVRFLVNQELALFFTIVLAALAGIMLGNSLPFCVQALVSSLIGVDRVAHARDRVGILKAGLVVGLVSIPTVLLFALAEGKGLSNESLITAAFSFAGNSIAIPLILLALTPVIQAAFGYASDIKLLELANLNHPALKELIVQAPGTYHHSIIIGSLVEAAAEAIGANPLLARSCAYYHDIGKGRNPLYFGENQRGENRHDALAPAMSAVIIKRHVTEGMEMARQYKLPKLVADAIPQHHGTRLVECFHQKALKEQEGKENPSPIDEALYRYPGPKPQFREAALVMLADVVEASSKSLADPSAENLKAAVDEWINQIFSEGQLDDCDLTLRELHQIAGAFVRTLDGIYRARPQDGGASRPIEPSRPVSVVIGGKSPEVKVGRPA